MKKYQVVFFERAEKVIARIGDFHECCKFLVKQALKESGAEVFTFDSDLIYDAETSYPIYRYGDMCGNFNNFDYSIEER